MSTSPPGSQPDTARRVVLFLAALVGVAMVATSAGAWWATGLVHASALEGDRDAVMRTLGRQAVERGSVEEALPLVADAFSPVGLSYMALMQRDGLVVAAVGGAAGPLPTAPEPGPRERIEHVERWIGPVPDVPGQPDPRDRVIVLEMVPLAADAMTATATMSLVVSILGACFLIGVVVVLDRLSSRTRHAEEALADGRRLAALGEMSAVLAHEIKNPLAALKGHAQLLLEDLPADTPAHRDAERVLKSARRLQVLVDDLLDFVRMQGVRRKDTDVLRLVHQVLDEAEASARVRVEGPAPTWALDPKRFRQVLDNVIRNALDVSDDVEILVKGGRQLVIDIADRGPGWPEGHEGRIFAPFHTTKSNGTGLGLAVSERLVSLHGGTIEAIDRDGGGAIVRITLPPAQETP